ncbi:hypothetical protein GCM10020216_073300 [Nonomuraea helvata]
MGTGCRAVDSGEQGLDRLRADLPDAVVLDLIELLTCCSDEPVTRRAAMHARLPLCCPKAGQGRPQSCAGRRSPRLARQPCIVVLNRLTGTDPSVLQEPVLQLRQTDQLVATGLIRPSRQRSRGLPGA